MIINSLVEVAKGVVKKPSTVEFPENKETLDDTYRGMHKLDMNTCINCQACARICPNQTIKMVEADIPTAFHKDTNPKLFPEIDLERCLFCALCEEVCPTDCLILTKITEYEVYDRRDLIKRPEDLE
ncbi:MAG: NADH-quinone oxidoreductase subunit I [Candidatus Marsarchaeota archaeon]|nr:NADH-quinone oxidoreductase subunit I [Candidatus Marsarchaeota archaeon]